MQQRAYNKFLHIYIIDINICKKTDMEKKTVESGRTYMVIE